MKRFIAAAVLAAAVWPAGNARAAITLDGIKDAGYGATPVATDNANDLATPGPADWNGATWTDQRELYTTIENGNLYIFNSLPNYITATSEGTFGLAIDVNNTATGGTADAWGNAITFGQASLPDYLIRGDVPKGNGWTELRSWSTANSNWNTGSGTNFGGLTAGVEDGTNIAWEGGSGVELMIPLSSLNAAPGDVLNIQFFGTQAGAGKGAYDSLLGDDFSNGWDDPTTLTKSASVVVPEPASVGLLALAGLGLAGRRSRRR